LATAFTQNVVVSNPLGGEGNGRRRRRRGREFAQAH
jgi:hypothetical protein